MRVIVEMEFSTFLRFTIILFVLHVLFFSDMVSASDRQVKDYQYDAAGNLTGKNTSTSIGTVSPGINTVSPVFIRKETTTAMSLDGTDLKNVQIVADHPGLSITNTVSSYSHASFDIYVASGVPLGPHTFTFSTLSGQMVRTIDVYPALPQLVVRPTPFSLAVGIPVDIVIGLNHADVIDHNLALTVSDQTVATASLATLSISAGQRFPASVVTLTGLKPGITTLVVSSSELGAQAFTVVVGNPYQPPSGAAMNARSDLLGVELSSNSPHIHLRGPVTSSISVELPPVLPVMNLVSHDIIAPHLGITLGSAFFHITPKAIAENTHALLTIDGNGLTSVTGVAINPPDGITVGVVQVNASGTQLTVPVDVASGVAFSERTIHLMTTGSEILPSNPVIKKLLIGGRRPVIGSINPLVVGRKSHQQLQITGKNFDGNVHVSVIPPDDMDIGDQATVNGAGDLISVDLHVGEYATTGPRVITVTNANGSTTPNALPSNTLTVANGIAGSIPVRSSPLGVSLGGNTQTIPISLYGSSVGVIFGSGVTDVSPASALRGSTVTLTITGYALQNVSAVILSPSQGISASAPQIAADGRSLTVDLTIAADAAITQRHLSLFAGSTPVAFSDSSKTVFTVFGPSPQIDYILPNFAVAGSTATITLRGQNFEQGSRVRVQPPQGVHLSTVQVSADNRQISLQVTVDSNAARGNRTLIVTTAAGDSLLNQVSSNQLNIVSSQLLAVNHSLVSPLLGIDKASNTTNTVTQTFYSDLIGVSIPVAPQARLETAYATPLSVVKGSYIDAVAPDALQVGSTTTLSMTGRGLQNTATVVVQPPDGINVQTPVINSQGNALQVDINVAANAARTRRRLSVQDSNGQVLPFVEANKSMVKVAGNLPVLSSITPVLQVPESQFELLIRGQNMQEVTAVKAYNSQGSIEPLIHFGNPVITPDGSQLRVRVVVERLVSSGVKSIVLVVPTGQTSIQATSVNTLTINTLSP